MTNKPTPNFIIIGAPKCGTTALADYLGSHDDIFVTSPKEPHYFATDLEGYRVAKTKSAYLGLFNNSSGLEKAMGEASVYYLYSDEAIRNIAEFNPEMKLIVMLRNPVDMVHSLHSQLVHSANENIYSFKDAWDSVLERRRGQNIPTNCRNHKVLDYRRIAKYASQLEKVYRHFPRNQVKVILFDNFKNNPLEVYLETLEFLDIAYDNRHSFPIINPNSVPRSIVLNRLLKKNKTTINLKDSIKAILHIKHIGLLDMIHRLNTKKNIRDPIPIDTKLEIFSAYREDTTKLGAILDVDLSHWMK